MVGKLWYLKKFNLFSDLEPDEVEELAERTRMETVVEADRLYLPGDSADTVYILKKGRVRLSRTTREGRKITMALLEPGEIFGELAPSEEEYQAEAQALQESLICSISSDEFRDFLSEHPELSLEVTRLVGERRRNVEARIENLIFRDAEERIVYVLGDLFENHSTGEGSRPEVEFTHEQVANLAGLTRPTTSNVLSQLKEKGIIDLGRGCIRLADPAGLERLSD